MNMVERSSGHAVLEWVALPAREIRGTLLDWKSRWSE